MLRPLVAPLLLLMLSVLGCQCFVPVSETPLSGHDGGVDAGSDAGTVATFPECRVAADCPAVHFDGGFTWCNDRAASCVAGRCLQECGGGRSCEVTDGGTCLACLASATECSQPHCASRQPCTMQIEASTCPGITPYSTVWTATRTEDCSREIVGPDGGFVGRWYDVNFAEGIATLSSVTGTCTVHQVPTNAPRAEWACPGCTFTEMGCE